MDSSPSFKKLLVRSLLLLGPSLAAAQSNLASCLETAGVSHMVEGAALWANETRPWQLRLKDEVEPAAMAYPTDKDQLAACLACAEQSDVKVSVLSGGHSFVAYGYGEPGNLVINVAAFNACSYDAASETYTIGGGSRVGPAMKQLWDENQRHFPHVRHGRVGVAGSSIGAGFGTTSRFLGTPMDNVVGAEVMLANGTVVLAEPGSDLLWALNGAGSSFGVVLSITTKTWQPTHANITTFTITLSPGLGPDAAAAAVLVAQEAALAGEMPDELALRFNFNGKPSYTTIGYFYGDPKDFDSVIQPLISKMPTNTTVESKSVEFWESEAAIAVGANLPMGGTSPPRTFYIQSLTTTADHPLSLETVTLAFQRATVDFNRTDLRASGFFDIYGGFSKGVKDSDHSHAIGNILWFIRMDTNTMKSTDPWPVDGEAYGKEILLPFEEALTAANQPLRGFANYRDSELSEEEWSSRLYGENYPRLKELKATFDPTGMFTSNKQSIAPPASADSSPAYYPMTTFSDAKNETEYKADPAPKEEEKKEEPAKEYRAEPAPKEEEKKPEPAEYKPVPVPKEEEKKEEPAKGYKADPAPKEEEKKKKEEPAKEYKADPAPKEKEKKEEPAKGYKADPAPKEKEKKEEPAKGYKADPAPKEEEKKKEEPAKEYKADPAPKEEEKKKKEEPAKEYKADPAPKEEEKKKKEEPAKEYKADPAPKEEEKKKEEPAKEYKADPAPKEEEKKKEEPAKEYKADPAPKEEEKKKEEPAKEYKADPAPKEEEKKKEEPAKEYKADPAPKEEEKKEEPAKEYKADPAPKEEEKKEEPAKGYKADPAPKEEKKENPTKESSCPKPKPKDS